VLRGAIQHLDTANLWFGEGKRTGAYQVRPIAQVIKASRPWRARPGRPAQVLVSFGEVGRIRTVQRVGGLLVVETGPSGLERASSIVETGPSARALQGQTPGRLYSAGAITASARACPPDDMPVCRGAKRRRQQRLVEPYAYRTAS
jgi:hypothetical protein